MKIIRLSEATEFPEPRELTPEELAEAYRLARESFTAADLARYADLDEGVSADEMLREMDEAQREHDQKKS